MAGPKNPPKLPKVQKRPRPPAAAVPRRKVEGKLKKAPKAAKFADSPIASAASTIAFDCVRLAAARHNAVSSHGSATCQMRSPFLELERPQRNIAGIAATKHAATTKPVAVFENPIARTICGNHR